MYFMQTPISQCGDACDIVFRFYKSIKIVSKELGTLKKKKRNEILLQPTTDDDVKDSNEAAAVIIAEPVPGSQYFKLPAKETCLKECIRSTCNPDTMCVPRKSTIEVEFGA
jgi:hypothetical protein